MVTSCYTCRVYPGTIIRITVVILFFFCVVVVVIVPFLAVKHGSQCGIGKAGHSALQHTLTRHLQRTRRQLDTVLAQTSTQTRHHTTRNVYRAPKATSQTGSGKSGGFVRRRRVSCQLRRCPRPRHHVGQVVYRSVTGRTFCLSCFTIHMHCIIIITTMIVRTIIITRIPSRTSSGRIYLHPCCPTSTRAHMPVAGSPSHRHHLTHTLRHILTSPLHRARHTITPLPSFASLLTRSIAAAFILTPTPHRCFPNAPQARCILFGGETVCHQRLTCPTGAPARDIGAKTTSQHLFITRGKHAQSTLLCLPRHHHIGVPVHHGQRASSQHRRLVGQRGHTHTRTGRSHRCAP